MKGSASAATPEQYIEKLPERRKGDLSELHRIIRTTVPRLQPTMAFGMIGYGPFDYKYASGREGKWVTVALASQKHYISLYVCSVDASGKQYIAEKYKKELGKVSVGKSCIRFKKLGDLNLQVLKRVLREAQRHGGAGHR